MKKLTTEEWVLLAKKVHGDKYDYSKTLYKTKKEKVCIICHEVDENGEEHGEFWQTSDAHSRENGLGCPKCKFKKLASDRRKDIDVFISQANKIHANKYKYTKFNYTSSHNKGIITCPIHGDFEQSPANHLKGKGCPECGKMKVSEKLTMSNDEFISRCKEIHSNYDYSITNYTGISNLIQYRCPIHGIITQNAQDHLHSRAGCPKCNKSKGEKFIFLYLESKNIKYESQYSISIDKDINPTGIAKVDFYLPKYNAIIEYNGILHYKPIERFGGVLQFKKQYRRDTYVRNYCKENKLKYIEIPYDIDFELVKDFLDYYLDNLDKGDIIVISTNMLKDLLNF